VRKCPQIISVLSAPEQDVTCKNLQFNSDGVLTDNSKPPDFLYYYTRAIYNLQLGLQFVKWFLGLQLLKMVFFFFF
jgi:hypothetical protein